MPSKESRRGRNRLERVSIKRFPNSYSLERLKKRPTLRGLESFVGPWLWGSNAVSESRPPLALRTLRPFFASFAVQGLTPQSTPRTSLRAQRHRLTNSNSTTTGFWQKETK